jgi:hypothetical protein
MSDRSSAFSVHEAPDRKAFGARSRALELKQLNPVGSRLDDLIDGALAAWLDQQKTALR